MSNPPKNALPLLEALTAWGKHGFLVESLCRIGEWRCWARRGSHDGPYVELEPDAWDRSPLAQSNMITRPGELRVICPDLLCRYDLREEPVKTRQDGRTIITIEEKLCTVEEWFDPVFAPADSIPPVRSHRDIAASRKEAIEWRDRNFGSRPPEEVPNRHRMLELAQVELGDHVKVSWLREGKPHSRRGRPPKKIGGK